MRRKKIDAQPSVLGLKKSKAVEDLTTIVESYVPDSKETETMPRKTVMQIMMERESKAANVGGKTELPKK